MCVSYLQFQNNTLASNNNYDPGNRHYIGGPISARVNIFRTFRNYSVRVVKGVATYWGAKKIARALAENFIANITDAIVSGAMCVLTAYECWCIARWIYNWFNSGRE